MAEKETFDPTCVTQGTTGFKDVAYASRAGEEKYRTVVENTSDATITAAIRAITRRKRADNIQQDQFVQLVRLSRLHALGEMTSHVAHQMGQPLCAIITNTHACLNMLQTKSVTTDELIEVLEEIVIQAERARGVAERIREFAHQREPRHERVDVRQIIDNSLKLFWKEIDSQYIEVFLDLPSDISDGAAPLFVLADSILIEQVVINLFRNAIDSMVATESQVRTLTIRATRTDHDMIDISVLDTGCGVPEDLHDRIFDPFQSTKAKGLGIGLSLGRSIIQSHNGHLWLEQNNDRGAVFHFTLPQA
jgi:C4-dicarboxylate-specific signal transduction histidine kinase